MLFFDDFIKKIEKTEVKPKEIEKFSLEAKKTALLLGTGIPLVLIGIFELYMAYAQGMKIAYLLMGAIFLFLAFKQMKLVFSYKLILNFKTNKLTSQGLDLSFDDIESCTLKEAVLGRGNRIQVVMEIMTNDKRKIIVPLIMGRKLYFARIMKDTLGKKFIILKK